VRARVCASSNAPSCNRSTTTARPKAASAPRPGGGVKRAHHSVGTALTAVAAVAAAALPSDRPCPATGPVQQRHRTAHTHATRQPRPTGGV